MATSLGSLVVSLGLDAANFVSGLTKAEYQAQQSLNKISNQFRDMARTVEGITAAIGLGFGVTGIIEWGKQITESAENLHKLSLETGSTVESLSKLQNIALVSGTSFDTMREVMDKLAAVMGGAAVKGSKVGEVMTLLGITAKDPAEAFTQLAVKMNQFADDTNKSALLYDAFRINGVQLAATLKAVAENTDITSTKTKEQAENAKRLAESLRTLSVESHALADIFLNDVAPGITKVVTALLDARRASDDWSSALRVFSDLSPFQNAGKAIEDLNAKIGRAEKTIADLNSGGFTLFKESRLAEAQAQLDALNKALDLTQKRQVRDFGGAPTNEQIVRPTAPKLPPSATGAVDDPARKILEGQIKAINDSIEREKAALSARADYLRDYYQQGYLSINDYYSKLSTAREDALQAELSYLDKSIAAEKAYQSTTAKDTDKQAAQNAIEGFQARKRKLLEEDTTAQDKQSRQQSVDTERYLDQLNEINAKILEIAGNTAAAGNIRFDAQNALLRNQLKSSGDTQKLGQVQFLEDQQNAQAKVNDGTREFNLLLAAQDIAQQKINLLQQSGAISEIEALTKSSEAARQNIDLLKAKADAIEQYAKTLSGPAQAEALLGVENLRLAIARLETQTDQLGDKFQNIFKSAFVDNLAAAIDGTKKWSDAFKDAEKQIVAGISRIAAQNIGDALFGKSGPLGGIGSIFGQIFGGTLGGGKGAAGASAADAALATLSATTVTTDAAFAATTTAALSAAAALESVALSSVSKSLGDGASLIGNLFNGISGLAGGTDFAKGGLTIVGERGPELVNMPRGAQVISNDVLKQRRASKTINQTFILPQGTSTASANQIALRVGSHTQRALSRDG